MKLYQTCSLHSVCIWLHNQQTCSLYHCFTASVFGCIYTKLVHCICVCTSGCIRHARCFSSFLLSLITSDNINTSSISPFVTEL
ncbi:hypothetical protein CARUB_v10006141mg [Capsella rubella]|uniref:Uncharacterized protein n=1 Tax=Capsella rubella TaxID=81985 RepID=R0GLJ2_9BRAS|nr:hypothetical protein CARUB_v10006141mg [Capsella rubella]